jgi:RNA polymerase sigma-70 factor (ECF subfamily)
VERVKRGESAAWNELYNQLAPAVAGYLKVRGAHEPDDLTSETFVAVFRNIATFDGDLDGLRSWVFVIAYRRLCDERRAEARHPDRARHRPTVDDQPHALGDVERDADAAMSEGEVRRVCARLAPDQADVVLLRILGDLTVEQIADVVDKSPGAVKQLLRRAFATLRKISEQQAVPL